MLRRYFVIAIVTFFLYKRVAAEEQCFIEENYAQNYYVMDKPQLLMIYLNKPTDVRGSWSLCVGNGKKKVQTCEQIDYTGYDGKTNNIRIFIADLNYFILAVKINYDVNIYSYKLDNKRLRKIESKKLAAAEINNLMHITLDQNNALYSSVTCSYIFPNSVAGNRVENCCKILSLNGYCLFDKGRKKAEFIKASSDTKSIFVYRCNYYFESVYKERMIATTYISHLPTLLDYNQVYCFKGTKNTAQFMMVDIEMMSNDTTMCSDINLKMLKLATVKPIQQMGIHITQGYEISGIFDEQFSIFKCFEDMYMVTATGADGVALLAIIVVIVLAQLGVRKKNKGRARAKWYKRRPRLRRRHRRHSTGGVSTYTTASQMVSGVTGVSQMPSTMGSQYTTTTGTSYY